jgi:outer membrane lipoprotein carrier protein
MIAPALATLLLATAPAAQDAASLARKVQDFYERTADLRARFVQTYTYAGFGGRKQTSKGTLRVKKPGMMRWDYVSPEAKTIAVKGSRLVQYEPEANQAYVDERFDASAMSAAVTFLLGKGDLAREFELDLSGAGWLVLTPRSPDPRVSSVELEVGPAGEVTATRVRDGSGNVNEIRFEDVRRNVGLSAADFDVALPDGVRRVTAPSP